MKTDRCPTWPIAILLLIAGVASADINLVTAPVGNLRNAPDLLTGFGSVSYRYNIGEFDVTAGQYTAFLNAVAANDPYSLYSPGMSAVLNGYMNAYECGITQSGSPGSYTYTTTRDRNYPVNNVTWGDAARFCNWLTNGQPSGAEGNGTTETGSYTLNGAVTDTALNAVTRNANADYVIPTENEWYKAAYYNPASGSYYTDPMQSNSEPSNVLSATGMNNANFFGSNYTDPVNYLTPVGAFADSASPYGTYDQGGDVNQWNESVYSGSNRGFRGGYFSFGSGALLSGTIGFDFPDEGYDNVGFRVSQVPEPASIALLGLGVIGMLLRQGRRAA